MQNDQLSIGEVARTAGVRTSKIRYYESVGLLDRAPRVSGRRVYARPVIERLEFIHFAQSAGFTIAEVRQILAGFDRRTPASRRWQTLAKQKLHEVAELIARAERMRGILEALTSCECVRLSDCTQRCGPPDVPPQPYSVARRAPARASRSPGSQPG